MRIPFIKMFIAFALVGCALPYTPSGPTIPSLSRSDVDGLLEHPHPGHLVVGKFDTSVYSAVETVNEPLCVVDCRLVGSFMQMVLHEGLSRYRIFEDVSLESRADGDSHRLQLHQLFEDVSLESRADGDSHHLKLQGWFQELSLEIVDRTTWVASAVLRAELVSATEGTVVWDTTLRQQTEVGNKQVDRALDDMVRELAGKLTIELAGSDEVARVASLSVDSPVPRSEADYSAFTETVSVVPGYVQGARPNLGSYHALVIGIDKYEFLEDLSTATNDARAVAALFTEHYGFSVRTLINPSRSDLLNSLGDLRRSLSLDDNLLIYYAGHGWLDEEADEGYWLASDARPDSEVNWISNATITASVRALQAKHVLVVADSCYSGKLTRGLHLRKKDPDYVSRMARKKARVVMSSGGLEPVLDRVGDSEHSIFATALLRVLTENDDVIDGTELFSLIRRPVMLSSDQVPEYADIRKAGHDGGDFLFVRTHSEAQDR